MNKSSMIESPGCHACPVHHHTHLLKLGLTMQNWDYVVALSGNPNTGKSTVFNALTGLRQHTGNWPGKTVSRAEGGFIFADTRYKLVDLPGTYSLLATSLDEEIARDFILFGRPDVTVVVVDATRLERNLNLVLQVLEITDRTVVCLNLIDEAKRHNIQIDERRLARDLGVPVVPTAARYGQGLADLLRTIDEVATAKIICKPHRFQGASGIFEQTVRQLTVQVEAAFPGLANARWVALRLLDGDERVIEAIEKGELGHLPQDRSELLAQPLPQNHAYPEVSSINGQSATANNLLELAQSLRWQIGQDFHQQLMESIYTEAARLADRAIIHIDGDSTSEWDRRLDRWVTSRLWGFPLMLLLFTVVFWITISGANIPSGWLAALLIDTLYPILHAGAAQLGFPWWLSGLFIDGAYLATAWVVSVMLPPMAIFFPLFTLLEDFGYLPRVAFNLDNFFKKSGAHGKQALSVMMGFGCNAAGVISTRIIDSPRERLIAIITNNFALCNGRWPTQILIASLFLGVLVPPYLAGVVSALAVVGVAFLGVMLTFIVSWGLSRSLLKGEVSTFSLELPPYRPPHFWRTLYTSLIDRTIFVLWRAVVFAMPAGVVIWLSANIEIGQASIAEHLINLLNPIGLLVGLNGVILVAYLVAIPANEIVIPTVLMLTILTAQVSGLGQGAGVMFEAESAETLMVLRAGGWTVLTAINLMLFSLIHNPCSTTLFTIYKETGSWKWTLISALLPLALGLTLCFSVATLWRLGG